MKGSGTPSDAVVYGVLAQCQCYFDKGCRGLFKLATFAEITLFNFGVFR